MNAYPLYQASGSIILPLRLWDEHELDKAEDAVADALQAARRAYAAAERKEWHPLVFPTAKYAAQGFVQNAYDSLVMSQSQKGEDHTGSLEWVLQCTPESLHFESTDNGVGLSAENREMLFKTKMQSPKRLRGDLVGGAGMHLSLAAKEMRQEDGTFGYVSIPGQGATFYFKIPLNPRVRR